MAGIIPIKHLIDKGVANTLEGEKAGLTVKELSDFRSSPVFRKQFLARMSKLLDMDIDEIGHISKEQPSHKHESLEKHTS